MQTLFYGVPSGCSFGSIVALEWIGRPYRLCRIEMPEEAKSDAFLAINPVGETPAFLTGDGRVLAESMAILNHIGAGTVGSGLAFAQGTAEFDRLNQMLAFLNTSLFGGFSPLWYTLEHALAPEATAPMRAYGAALLRKAHADLEAMLGEEPWLLGRERSLADAYFAGIARWTKYHDVIDRADYAGLQRLYERLQEDDAVRFAHAVEAGEAVASTACAGHVALAEIAADRAGGRRHRAA